VTPRFSLKLWLLPLMLLVAGTVPLRAEEPAKKDEPAKKHIEHVQGSRFVPVHRMPLKNSEGKVIKPDDEGYLCFRLQDTCGKCHVYKKISAGWHFNAPDPKVDPGRPGQPWFLVHEGAGTAIPVSYRNWPHVHRPNDLGITPRAFVEAFGHHMPGGGPGELTEVEDPDAKWHITGSLEVNCLACHSGDRSYDHIQYFLAIAAQNFEWAPAAGLTEFCTVKGSARKMPMDYMRDMGPANEEQAKDAPRVVYNKGRFDAKNEVFFDIARPPMNDRCYYCHSVRPVGPGVPAFFKTDQDVHMRAGMRCTECHRNGEEHNIRRGYEGEAGTELDPLLDSLSCRGCHLGGGKSVGGRMGAPKPEHKGLPPHHLEKLTCTACHSGPYPEATTHLVQTSQSHGLELQGPHRRDDTAPLIVEPVFAKREYDRKIGPQRMVWPSFWAREKEGKVKPIGPEAVVKTAAAAFAAKAERNEKQLTPECVAYILAALGGKDSPEGEPVYISGGRLYRRAGEKDLKDEPHAAASPVAWPIGHNVRPATESLGVKGCVECHGAGAPFHFGNVKIPTLAALPVADVKMHEFLQKDPVELEAWALSYRFRTFFKYMGCAAAAVIALVLLAYATHGVRGLSDWLRRHLAPGGRGE